MPLDPRPSSTIVPRWIDDTWRRLAAALRRDYEPRGAIAAWAADRYQLGKRRATLRTLRRLARHHNLPGTTVTRYETDVRSQLRFVRHLDRDLRRLGYRRRPRPPALPRKNLSATPSATSTTQC